MLTTPQNPADWPAELSQFAQRQWQRFIEKVEPDEWLPFQTKLTQAFALSDFLFDTFFLKPSEALVWLQRDSFAQPMGAQRIAQIIQQAVAEAHSEAELMCALRVCRRQIQSHIVWRDLMGLASLNEVLEATSALADEAIIQSRDWLHQALVTRWGEPMSGNGSGDGQPQCLMIIGMGKLGGRELNVSSDVDLIFAYPERGVTQGSRRERDNQEFFIRLGQRLIHVLNQITAEGCVFRVDMRLRPFGNSGPLAIPFSALEDYYQHQAREWERYAMVKARVLGPDCHAQQVLDKLLQPFVYRRYIDFSAFQSLRKMKLLIQQEVKRRQLKNNIKLGAGGIREIEFVAQALQLIRGGREPQLRLRGLLDTLAALGRLDYFPSQQAEQLTAAYCYLRKLEHALQGIADEQTQTLPTAALKQLRIASSMGEKCWHNLLATLAAQQAIVHACFDDVIGEQVTQTQESAATLKAMPLWPDIWQDELMLGVCEELVVEQAREFYVALKTFYEKSHKRQLGPRGRDALEQLMPKLLGSICQRSDATESLQPVLQVMATILTRSTYIELLLESPQALAQLIRFCRASDWIAQELARHPILLDELLDPVQLVSPTELTVYADELRQFMLRVSEDDLEQQMEALRHFKQIQQLRIAAADIAGALPLMQVSDHLTRLAEVLLQFVVHAAWQQLVARFGIPQGVTKVEECVAVIGYGKLGGLELGYGSDLDLVFFHTAPQGLTCGPKPIATSQFLAKLVQRISHLMTTRTHAGELYEIDLRLRPSGASGVLVTSLDSLAAYQRQDAWVWEHQALVRTRCVFGCEALQQSFVQLRHQLLTQPREAQALALEVVKMRHKMRQHLGSKQPHKFDLKQDAGGIADIEFLAQYLVLRFAQSHPQMTQWSDNARIFTVAGELGLLTELQVSQLISAYASYRGRGHRLVLQNQKTVVADGEFAQQREQINAIWRLFFNATEQQLLELE